MLSPRAYVRNDAGGATAAGTLWNEGRRDAAVAEAPGAAGGGAVGGGHWEAVRCGGQLGIASVKKLRWVFLNVSLYIIIIRKYNQIITTSGASNIICVAYTRGVMRSAGTGAHPTLAQSRLAYR